MEIIYRVWEQIFIKNSFYDCTSKCSRVKLVIEVTNSVKPDIVFSPSHMNVVNRCK